MPLDLKFRLATKNDLPAIVRLLADDPLGKTRENPGEEIPATYFTAFEKISSDPNEELTVVEMNGEIVATFQLSFIQYLTHSGTLRAQVENVRTASAHRGKGIGAETFEYIKQRAREKGCKILQLTSDKRRTDAIRFYEAVGFTATHQGMKLVLQ